MEGILTRFQEFLLFVLPLLPRHTIRRATSATLTAMTAPFSALSKLITGNTLHDGKLQTTNRHGGPYDGLPEDECAICHENAGFKVDLSSRVRGNPTTDHTASVHTDNESPIYSILTPYRTSCGHVYCYVCISDRLLRAVDDGTQSWPCLRCAEPVYKTERILEPSYWTGDADGDEGSAFEYNSDYFDELGSSMSAISRISMGSRSWSEGDQSE